MSDVFRFSPELFEHKTKALEVLADNDIVWMVDFSGVDVVHDLYGIEIEGIPDEALATRIMGIMRASFEFELAPVNKWKHSRTYPEHSGWVVEINKYPHPEMESWLTPDDE